MKLQFSKILVTGGSGFIGSHIVEKLLSKGFEVTILDNLSSGRWENISHHQNNEMFHFINGDIRDLNVIKQSLKGQEVVFHEAAITDVSFSIENPMITNEINLTGTLNLLKSCLDADVKRFIFASSASVYGDTSAPPLREDMKLNPKSPYAVSKIAADNYVQLFYKLYGLETIILRYFNVYGCGARIDQGVISVFINRILNNQSPIIYGDGEQTRDFINVEDVADANILSLYAKKGIGEIMNIGAGFPTSINQIVKLLLENMGNKHISPIYTDPRPGDPRHGYYDITKARSLLNFQTKITIKEGIIQLVEWYRTKSRRN